MLVRFWGTRGSIAAPGPGTIRYGGNTSCVEVRSGESLAILDCGTGARQLGGFLAAEGSPVRAHILLTHFHWDHIQGFPFFFPVFLPGSEVNVYGAAGLEQGLEEAMSGQMQYTYFPIRLTELRSRINFHELGETTFHAGNMVVHTQFLNHTSPTLGYRLEAGGISVAYMTDHEPFWPHNPDLSLEEALVHPGDQRHVTSIAGVDLLIHDAQYTSAEYPARRGWGHSTIDYVVDVAVAAGVKRLALFHHDPPRQDEAVDHLVRAAQERLRARGAEIEVFAAAEGQVVEMEEHAEAVALPAVAPLTILHSPARVLILGDPERRRALREALVEDGYQVLEAGLDESLFERVTAEPDLVVAAIPAEADPAEAVSIVSSAVNERPVVAVLDGEVDEPTMRRVGEVAADVVVSPYGVPNLRARVRAWLARRPTTSDLLERLPVSDALNVGDRLTSEELEGMLLTAARCGFKPGEVLFRQGDPAAGVYYLHAGLVRIAVFGPDGKEITVGFAGPGDTVGEMSALDGQARSATLVALEPIEASYVSREAFRQTLERSPQASLRLLRLLARRMREVDQRFVEHATMASAAHAAGGEPSGPAQAGVRQRVARLETQQHETAEERHEGYVPNVTEAYLRLREWRQGIRALRTIARVLSVGRGPRSLDRRAVETLANLIPCRAIGLYLFDPSAVELGRAAAHGEALPQGWHVRMAPGPVSAALRFGKHQVAQEPASPEAAESTWHLAVPLRAHGRSLGVIWMWLDAAPTEDQLALAEIVGAAYAVALRSQQGQGTEMTAEVSLATLETTLDREVERARRLGYPIGVLVGHLESKGSSPRRNGSPRAPDIVSAVRSALRRTDVVASTASGALGVILPGITPEGLRIVEARIQQVIQHTLARQRTATPVSQLRMGSSIVFPEEADARTLLKRALGAMQGNGQ
jgi:CRP-like cAMP-binding protein/phosphoribosyl 1,2-cyclic phosphodiesterase